MANFLAALKINSGPSPQYVSLVPTQLGRLLAPDAGSGISALRDFAAVLVGGAPCPADLSARARDLGINLVETYGAAETAGGCVYDGISLGGTTVKLDDDGRIMVSGPTLALGYAQSGPPGPRDGPVPKEEHPAHSRPNPSRLLDSGAINLPNPSARFASSGHERWFTTSDLGHFNSNGRLLVLGRADDVIVSGGLKIIPQQIENIIKTLPGIDDTVVVGLPDQDWGQSPTALIVTKPGVNIGPEKICQAICDQVGPTSRPRLILTVAALPMLPSGKVDRAAASLLAGQSG